MMEVGNFPHPVSVDNGGNLGYLLQVTFITWGKMGWTQFPEGDRKGSPLPCFSPVPCSPFPVPRSLLLPVPSCYNISAFIHE
jgi:hypothetical protein